MTNQSENLEHLLSRDEAAVIIRKPSSWLRYAERRGLVPFIRIGRQIRYRRSELLAWVDSKAQPVREGQ